MRKEGKKKDKKGKSEGGNERQDRGPKEVRGYEGVVKAGWVIRGYTDTLITEIRKVNIFWYL